MPNPYADIVRTVKGFVPCYVLKALRATEGTRCAPSAIRSPSPEAREAFQLYDNLQGDPSQELTFTVQEKDRSGNLTGRAQRVTTRIADMCFLGNDLQDTTRALRSLVDSAIETGIAVRAPLSDNDRNTMLRGSATMVTRQVRDPFMADASRIMDYPLPLRPINPVVDPYHPTDSRLVPEWFPRIGPARTVINLTPRALNRDGVPTRQLRALYDNLVMGIHAYLKSCNVPMKFHPAVMGTLAPFRMDRYAYTNIDERASQDVQQWSDDNGNPLFLVQNSVRGWTYPDGDVNQGPNITGGGQSSGLWNTALDRRLPVTISTGTTVTRGALAFAHPDTEERRTWNVYTADPLLEILRLLNCAQFLLDSGDVSRFGAKAPAVHMYAASALYKGATVEAYRQIGRPYGSNVVGYRQAVEAELASIRAGGRASGNIPGFVTEGDSAADIAATTLQIIGPALAAAATVWPVGTIISVVVAGTLILVSLFGRPDAPPNPFDYPLRVAGWTPVSPVLYGITVRAALEDRPLFRLNRSDR